MEKFIETIASYLEIMVLGAVGIAFLGYTLAIFHPFRQTVADYFTRLAKLYFSATSNEAKPTSPEPPSKPPDGTPKQDGIERKLTEALTIGIQLGIIYYAGVLANAAAYWALHPAHINIIAHVKLKQPNLADPRTGVPDVDESGCDFLVLPFCRQEKPQGAEKQHEDSLYRDVAWRNANPDAAGRVLDPINKFLRLLRGTALFAMCFGIAALLKILGSTIVLGLTIVASVFDACRRRFCPSSPSPSQDSASGSRSSPAPQQDSKSHSWIARRIIWLYVNFVDDRRWAAERKERIALDNRRDDVRPFFYDFKRMSKLTFFSVMCPNLCILFLALVIYVVAMFSWKTAEVEYHSMVLAGQATAAKVEPEAKKASDPLKKAEP